MCLKKYFTVFVVPFFFISQLGFTQVSTYGFGEAISTYTPLSTSTTAYTAPWDDHVSGLAYLAPLGFTYNYDGVSQTQCYISTNGFLTFGTQPVPNNYFPINSAVPVVNGGTSG